MYENNEQPQPVSAVLTYEELQAKASAFEQQCGNLEAEVRSLTARLNSQIELNRVQQSTLEKAENWVRDQIEGSMEPKETLEELDGLIDILGVETTREVEIEIQVSWRGTINLPYGVEVEDLDIDDFGIGDPDHNEYDTTFWRGMEDYGITER